MNSSKVNSKLKIIENLNTFKKWETIFRLSIHSITIICGIFMFVIYFQPSLRRLSVSVYYRGVAVFSAFESLLNLFFHFFHSFNLKKLKLINCNLKFFLLDISGSCLIWFEVISSIDRFLTIVFPLKTNLIKKLNFQRIVVIVIIIYNLMFYSTDFIFYNLKTINKIRLNKTVVFQECHLENENELLITIFINKSAIPFVLMFALTIAIFIGVIRVHKRLKLVTSRNKWNQTRQRDIKFGITMIVSNLIFFVLNFPWYFLFILRVNPFNAVDNFLGYYIFNAVLNDSIKFYFSTIFFTHLASNSLVRKEFLNLIKKGFFKIFKHRQT